VSASAFTCVVPSRGLAALLRACIAHLAAALAELPPAAHRIVVVDDASDLPLRASELRSAGRNVPALEVVRHDTHHCFAASCNAGAARGAGDRILLLNNDVLLHRMALVDMQALLAKPSVGICGARLVFPDDTIQHCGVVFGPGEAGPCHDRRRVPTHLVPRRPRVLGAVTGACMLIRRACFEELGGLDDSYPFGLEDVDLCLRARRRGWQVVCAQAHDSLHFESMTEGRVALDVASRRLFMERWRGAYGIDTFEGPPEAGGRR